jgi:hypothetical protein
MCCILSTALLLAGMLHFGLLVASFSVPRLLHWDEELGKVDPLTRQLVLVHGAFIVLTIIAFGVITLVAGADLLGGGALSTAVAAFIGLFWLARLAVQLFYFEPQRYLTTGVRRIAYRLLTVLFAYLATVYLLTAWINLMTGTHS